MAPGNANQCEACVVDGDCDDGSRCVEVRYPVGGGVEDVVEIYCALDRALINDDGQINVGRGNH